MTSHIQDTLQHLEQAPLTRPVLHTSGLVAVKGPDLELAHKNTRGWHAMNFLHHSYVDLGYLAEHSLDDPPHRTLDRSHFSHGLDLAVLQDIVADITPNMLQAEPHAVVRAVLDRLDVYVPGTPPIHWGPSDIVDAHIGTLVIVFPTHHSGGALTFTRGNGSGDCLPRGRPGHWRCNGPYCDHIDSGYRVTMSYKLFAVQRGERAMCGPGLSSAEDEMSLAMRRLAAALFPPNSDGMLCFGLVHAYPIPCTPTDERSLRDVVPLLRGVDKRIATAARAAGMEVLVRLVYEVEPEELLANDDDCATELYHVAVDRVLAMSGVDHDFEPVDGQRAAWRILSAGEILCPVSVTPPTLKRSRSRQPSRSDDFSKVLDGKRATFVDAHWVTPLTQINCAKSSFLYADNKRPGIKNREAYAALFVHIPHAESEEKDADAVRELAELRMRIDAVNSDARAIGYTLDTFDVGGKNPLRALAAIDDTMRDLGELQAAHYAMQERVVGDVGEKEVQDWITEQRERAETAGVVENGEGKADGDREEKHREETVVKGKGKEKENPKPSWKEKEEAPTPAKAKAPVKAKPKKKGTRANITREALMNTVLPPKKPTKLRPRAEPPIPPTLRPRKAGAVATPVVSPTSDTVAPPLPEGFDTWTAVYAVPQMHVVAKAQARADLKTWPQASSGHVTVPLVPCARCSQLDIPCLVVDARGNKSCIACHDKTKGAHVVCIAGGKAAKLHKLADAVADLHNYAIARGEQPGVWMGEDEPPLELPETEPETAPVKMEPAASPKIDTKPRLPARAAPTTDTPQATTSRLRKRPHEEVDDPADSDFPSPPAGVKSWPALYASGSMPKLATAEARPDLGDDRIKIGVTNYGYVAVAPRPCRQCVQLDVPCLRLHDPAAAPRGGSCVLCAIYRPSRLLVEDYKPMCRVMEDAEPHQYAAAVAKYHNYAVGKGRRPGRWMGPGQPPFEGHLPTRKWGRPFERARVFAAYEKEDGKGEEKAKGKEKGKEKEPARKKAKRVCKWWNGPPSFIPPSSNPRTGLNQPKQCFQLSLSLHCSFLLPSLALALSPVPAREDPQQGRRAFAFLGRADETDLAPPPPEQTDLAPPGPPPEDPQQGRRAAVVRRQEEDPGQGGEEDTNPGEGEEDPNPGEGEEGPGGRKA
ncbi:hypothetical protein MIND_01406000 [Mycena indigotica]|uniref:Uncharacterized protein n=1 Tax=Mycena indigotica TaxID=2126181 RepID=A0A8H6RYH3_9AGAR|nr:uncharacterized protein MIND_01406000 [Mycena indigotica]KAF7288900.1 hypothetical protein MIND_01406000 [Mycena indigotica]